MYNWNNDRRFPSSKSFSAYYFSPKNINLIQNSFDPFNFNHLPVIKEEDGSLYEDEEEPQSRGKLLPPDTLAKKKLPKKDEISLTDSNDNSENQEQIKEAKTFTKLPPLVNINCLMNTEIKQSHNIWETNFGKRLIQGKKENLNLDKTDLEDTEEGNSKKEPEQPKKSKNELLKFPLKRKSIAEQYVKNAGGDTADSVTHKKLAKRKVKKSIKSNQNSAKKSCEEKDSLEDNQKANDKKSSKEVMQSSSKEILLPKPILKAPLSKTETEEGVSNISSFSRNRHFLTECVKSILDNNSNQVECEHCKQQFSNVEELCQHKKQHETKKEICLLCEKIFYNPNEFIQHLLRHEGVDKFSCKKCKKYFPTLKKYKQHCLDFHFTPQKPPNCPSLTSLEYVKKWLPKFECQRCKAEVNSEKELEDHKRYHIKMDLAGAYLLSSKNM